MTIDEICDNERRNGWFVKLFTRADDFECLMECSPDIVPTGLPRPRAIGATMAIALTLAIRDRNKKYGKSKRELLKS